jgi:hypothetical protein
MSWMAPAEEEKEALVPEEFNGKNLKTRSGERERVITGRELVTGTWRANGFAVLTGASI